MTQPLLLVDPSSHVPPYEQIGDQIRTLIAGGELQAGSQLPSVRQMARDLSVAPNTVVKAYGMLEQEGWIVSRFRHGFSVAGDVSRLVADERSHQLEQAARQFVDIARRMGVGAEDARGIVDRLLRHGDRRVVPPEGETSSA